MKQISYLNILKTIAIFCVCAVHVPLFSESALSNLSQMVLHIGVPVFFMVNGALLFNRPFDMKKHIRRTVNLIIVSTVWRAILLGLSFLKTNKPVLTFSGTVNYFLGGQLEQVPTAHFWFINVLIGLYILFPILKLCFDSPDGKKILFWFSVCVGAVFFTTQLLGYLRVYAIEYLGKGMELNFSWILQYVQVRGWYVVYFVLGGLLHEYFYERGNLPNRKQRLLACGAFFLGWGMLYVLKGLYTGFTGSLQDPFGIFDADGAYSTFSTCFMSVGIYIALCGLEVRNKVLCSVFTAVGRNTLVVFYIHLFLTQALVKFVPLFSLQGVGINTLKAAVVLTAGVCCGMLLKRIPLLKKLA